MLCFSSCAIQHAKRSIKKNPTYWDYYIMIISLTSPLTLLILKHTCGRSKYYWPLLSFLLFYWIAGIGIVFHCKHKLIHWYIQSLNPILKILKFKYLQIRHKPCLSPFLVTNWPQRHNRFHENPLTLHPLWNRGYSSNSPPLGRLW